MTITSLVTPDDPEALRGWFEALEDGMARYGKDEPRALPEGAEPLVGFDLTTHRGHFMGSGHNRLMLYTHEGKAWVKAAGTWDPMPWHLDKAYQQPPASEAQHAFWGQEELSMLHQLAKQLIRVSDAVVIGAGPNGLAAAIRLAEAGRSVLLLEAADAPGGAVRTEELTLPGFKHDTFSSVYPASAASPVFARMPLAEHGLEWVHPAAAYAHPLPGGEAKLLYRGLDETAASLGGRDGEQLGALRAPVPGQLRRRAGDDALRLPAARRPVEAARRRRAAAAARLHAHAAGLRGRARASACSTTAARRPGSTAPRCTATRRPTAPGVASPRSTSTCSGTPSAGRRRAAAPSG